jgi:molybdenum cofactor biosynthesis protein MoaC
LNKLSHVDSSGKINMVDVSGKQITTRIATASATVLLSKKIFRAVKQNTISKGDVLASAKIAGIQAAKKTSELIPLCHNIFLSNVDIQYKFNSAKSSIEILSTVKSAAQTGVEMEALISVSIAALSVYDMCKAMSKGIEITGIHLISKSGGKSGDYVRGRSKNGR